MIPPLPFVVTFSVPPSMVSALEVFAPRMDVAAGSRLTPCGAAPVAVSSTNAPVWMRTPPVNAFAALVSRQFPLEKVSPPPPEITPASVTSPAPLPPKVSALAAEKFVAMVNAPLPFCAICGLVAPLLTNCSALPAIVSGTLAELFSAMLWSWKVPARSFVLV